MMRTRIVTLLVAALALLPWDARAQDDTEGQSEEAAPEGGGETEGAEVVDQPGQVRVTPEGGKPTAPGEVHTVIKGDTLWDLSQHYLGSPWYWPKVWSYNPEIANPHWIYPGNLVRFFPSGEEVPTQVEVGTGPEPEEPIEAADRITEDASTVSVAGKIGYTAKPGVRLMHVGFVTPKELDEAGRIDSSFAESEMLSYPDTVYLTFKKKNEVKIGDRYTIFRTRAEVVHPVSGNRFGYMTQFLGQVKVIAMSEKLVTALIENTYDEVKRGDLIGPFGEQQLKIVSARPNERELKGFLITTLEPDATMIGEQHLVVVDKGGSDGVQVGNTFTVIRQGDGLRANFLNPAEPEAGMPIEDVGACMAIDVKDKATTCLVTRSLRDLVAGDRVVMRAGGSAGAPRASLR